MLAERDRRCHGSPTITSIAAGVAGGLIGVAALVTGVALERLSVGVRATLVGVDVVAALVLFAGMRRAWRRARRYEWALLAALIALLVTGVVGARTAASGDERAAAVGQVMAFCVAAVVGAALACDGRASVASALIPVARSV